MIFVVLGVGGGECMIIRKWILRGTLGNNKPANGINSSFVVGCMRVKNI